MGKEFRLLGCILYMNQTVYATFNKEGINFPPATYRTPSEGLKFVIIYDLSLKGISLFKNL